MRINILGVGIDGLTMSEAVARVESFINSKQPHQIVTANSEMVMLAQEDREFCAILQQADLVTGDGAGVVWASGKYGQKLPGRVTGVDLIQQLLPILAQKKYRIFLLGAAPGVAEQARQKMQEQYAGLHFVGIRDGYFKAEEEAAVLAEIKAAHPDLLLVGLGFPRQEKWIKAHLQELQVPVAIGIGGALDVFSGRVNRAPVWMQKCNLEWLHRLLKEPERIGRMMVLPKFVWRVLGDKRSENH